ncbi:hypothetical protein L873DRAFT_281073 [Choiromyces venosus 120613-1]|uniref:Uncharacterized protein n=1 Tax=Choiromyces venosus 120613-1 TaxID=1336337 RepID=A0A3N4JXP9_9PEZI|nr:hypothetical protein L873DRAFT_281073 [Choiromyces venosus 120613-1]
MKYRTVPFLPSLPSSFNQPANQATVLLLLLPSTIQCHYQSISNQSINQSIDQQNQFTKSSIHTVIITMMILYLFRDYYFILIFLTGQVQYKSGTHTYSTYRHTYVRTVPLPIPFPSLPFKATRTSPHPGITPYTNPNLTRPTNQQRSNNVTSKTTDILYPHPYIHTYIPTIPYSPSSGREREKYETSNSQGVILMAGRSRREKKNHP